MRLVIISDTHGEHYRLRNIPDGDVLIHCGDFSISDRLSMMDFNDWAKNLVENLGYSFKKILIVPGNHDTLLDSAYDNLSEEQIQYILDVTMADCEILMDREITIDGYKFYGTPWVKPFCNWAFEANEIELEILYSNIPLDTDVLITHTPPHGVMDLGYRRAPNNDVATEHCGPKALMDRIIEVKPKVHCFGHIHHFYGKEEKNGTIFVNASMLDGDWNMLTPIVVDI